MKKLVYILSSLLLLSAGFTACSSDSDEPEQPTSHQDEVPAGSTEYIQYGTLYPVEQSREVTSFFNHNIYKWFLTNIEEGVDTCIVINNAEELKAIYSGKEEIPSIDFRNYTLLIGKASMPYGYRVCSQRLNLDGQKSTLSITYDWPLGTGAVIINSDMPYWGVYPKCIVNNFNVQLTKEKEVTEIESFFRDHLLIQGYGPSEHRGTENFSPLKEDTSLFPNNDHKCIIINSMEELATIYCGTDPLPEIDFSTTTVILGRAFASNGYKFRYIEVNNEEDETNVTLHFKQREGMWTSDIIFYYFWALCPKFSPKEIVTFNCEVDLLYYHQ